MLNITHLWQLHNLLSIYRDQMESSGYNEQFIADQLASIDSITKSVRSEIFAYSCEPDNDILG